MKATAFRVEILIERRAEQMLHAGRMGCELCIQIVEQMPRFALHQVGINLPACRPQRQHANARALSRQTRCLKTSGMFV